MPTPTGDTRLLGVHFPPTGHFRSTFDHAASLPAQATQWQAAITERLQQNCSITVSYDPSEIPAIIDWIYDKVQLRRRDLGAARFGRLNRFQPDV